MSGPNSDYDPVEVTPLKAEEVDAMRDAALAAVAAAGTLEELKQVRTAHGGTVSIGDADGGGALVEVRWPVADQRTLS